MIFYSLVINIHGLDGAREVPSCLRRLLSSRFLFALLMNPCPLTKVRPSKNSSDDILRDLNTRTSSNNFHPTDTDSIHKNLEIEETRVNKGESEENVTFPWKMLAVVLDRVMFLLNSLAVLLELVVFTNFNGQN